MRRPLQVPVPIKRGHSGRSFTRKPGPANQFIIITKSFQIIDLRSISCGSLAPAVGRGPLEAETTLQCQRPTVKQVSDLHIVDNLPLPAPEKLCGEIGHNEAQAAFVSESRRQIREILFGDDSRLLVVVGPCSIHDVKAGREYAERLAGLQARVREELLLVMRVYFEKPRTTVGWKGLIMDPHLDGTDDIPEGLKRARRFLLEVIDLGVPTATELLDPITPQYIADLVCWSAIGARTTESQTHRQMASGLSMPLGFKNGTNGAITPAINAIKAAMQPQTFLGVGHDGLASAVRTKGNPDCHVILRGGDDGPNFGPEHVAAAEGLLVQAGLPRAIMIDASHGNCDKDHEKQPAVFRAVLDQRLRGASSIIGMMLESNLNAGKQAFPQAAGDLAYGVSITDPCIDWETTEGLIVEAAKKLARG